MTLQNKTKKRKTKQTMIASPHSKTNVQETVSTPTTDVVPSSISTISSSSQKKAKLLPSTVRFRGLIKALEVAFPELKIEIDTKTHNLEWHVFGYQCMNHERCECFKLIVKIVSKIKLEVELDHIKYGASTECTLSGTDILTRLTKSFGDAKVELVMLYDVAKMGTEKTELYVFSILMYGKSWYNRFGYVSHEYNAEVKHNTEIVKSQLSLSMWKKLDNVCPGCVAKTDTVQETMMKLVSKMKSGDTNASLAYAELHPHMKKKIKYNFYLTQSFSS